MQTTRRTLLEFVGGSAAGALFTPAPWRLITDAALLSENWPGIPRPAGGEMRTRYNNCSLCPAGCAVRARCVGDQPVSLTGVKGHPLSRGAMCPWGAAAHHLPYHPSRLRSGPLGLAHPAIADAIADCASSEHVAVLDLRPGRTASWTYRRAMAAIPNGIYIARPEPGWGFDLSAARTVLSLGAPLVDGWGTPGNVFETRGKFRLIQADSVETRTAAFADVWLPVRPGTEGALAQAVAGEIGADEAARLTGLEETQVRTVVDELRATGPALVLSRHDMAEAARANQALGAFSRTIVVRRATPVPAEWRQSAGVTPFEQVPDGSVRVLLIDEAAAGESIPWNAIAPKLAGGALVATFAWTAGGYGRHARFTLPAPVAGEALDDMPAAVDGVVATFRLATPWSTPPPGVMNPPEFIAKLAGITVDSAQRDRADAIHKSAHGLVFTPADSKTTALKEMTADDFWKALNAGACWMDDKLNGSGHGLIDSRKNSAAAGQDGILRGDRPSTRGPSADRPAGCEPTPHGFGSARALTLALDGRLAIVSGEAAPPPLTSPLSSKLYRESNLRQAPDRIALAPATARACGVSDGGRAILDAGGTRLSVTVAIDSGLPPGVVRVAGDIPAARGKVVAA